MTALVPSGLNLTDRASPACCLRAIGFAEPSRLQTVTVPCLEPVSALVPSGLNATVKTAYLSLLNFTGQGTAPRGGSDSVNPVSVGSSSLSDGPIPFAFQTRVTPSREPAMTFSPSTLNAIAVNVSVRPSSSTGRAGSLALQTRAFRSTDP